LGCSSSSFTASAAAATCKTLAPVGICKLRLFGWNAWLADCDNKKPTQYNPSDRDGKKIKSVNQQMSFTRIEVEEREK
jgi:hypothetical protein